MPFLITSGASQQTKVVKHCIKIITQKRVNGLKRLLDSLKKAQYGNDDIIDVDIYIDALPTKSNSGEKSFQNYLKNNDEMRDIQSRKILLEFTKTWEWSYGTKKIHDITEFRGIRKQWLNVYSEEEKNNEEDNGIVVIFEDDLIVSPFYFIWLKNAHKFYSHRDDIAGYSLHNWKITATGKTIEKIRTENNSAFLQLQVGPWGFSPNMHVWKKFLNSFSSVDVNIPELISTKWYQDHLKRGKGYAMWTHTFMSYCYHNNLFTVYPNLRNNRELAIHLELNGEHFKNSILRVSQLQESVDDAIFSFNTMPLRLGIGGEVIDENNNTNMHHALEDPVTFTHKGRNRVLQAYGDTVATPSSAGSICLQESSGLELTLTPFGFFYVLLAFVATVLALIWFHFKRRNSNSNAMQEKGKEENYRLRKRLIFHVDSNVGVVIEFFFLLFSASVGEFLLPARAPTTTQSGQMDMWCFTMLMSVLGSVAYIEKVKDGEDFPLNRRQTNEWKGWMQVAFVMYHYAHAEPIFAPIRVFVSAYVWMTGFGNGIFFWTKSDFSAKRFWQCIWRMNFLVVPLSLVSHTAWILYYVVALHTTHFIFIYLCLGLGKKIAILRRWRGKGTFKGIAPIKERLVGITLLFLLTFILWDIPVVYKWIIDAPLRFMFGAGFADYFQYRTHTDHWSSWTGLVFASVYPLLKEKYISGQLKPMSFWWVACGLITTLLAVVQTIIWVQSYPPTWDHAKNVEYATKLHPYIGTLIIPFYIFIRNCHPILTNHIAMPFEKLGGWSLETYLLQFHIFLNRQASHHAIIIPGLMYINMLVVLVLYITVAKRLFEISASMRDIAFGCDKKQVGWASFALLVGLGIAALMYLIPLLQNFRTVWYILYFINGIIALAAFIFQCVTYMRMNCSTVGKTASTISATGIDIIEDVEQNVNTEMSPIANVRKPCNGPEINADEHANEGSCFIVYTDDSKKRATKKHGIHPANDRFSLFYNLKFIGLVALWVIGYMQLGIPYTKKKCDTAGDVGLANVENDGTIMKCTAGTLPCKPIGEASTFQKPNFAKTCPTANKNKKTSGKCKCNQDLPRGHWKELSSDASSSKQCAANPVKFGAKAVEWQWDPACCACFDNTRPNIKKCMQGRHILFAGDSTTRQPVYDFFRFLSEDEDVNKNRWKNFDEYVKGKDSWLTKYASASENWFFRPDFDIHDMQLKPPYVLKKNLAKKNIILHPCRKRGENASEPWAHGLWNDRTNRQSFAYACPSHRIETTDLTYHDTELNAKIDFKYLAQQYGLDDIDFWPLYFNHNKPDLVYISKGNHDIRIGVGLFNEDASIFNFYENTLTLLGTIRRYYDGPIIWRHNYWWCCGPGASHPTFRYRAAVQKILKQYPNVIPLDGYRITENGCGNEGQPGRPSDTVHYPAKISPLVWESVVRYACRECCQ